MPEGDYEEPTIQRASDTTTRHDRSSLGAAPSSSPRRANGVHTKIRRISTPDRYAVKSEDGGGVQEEKSGSKRKRPGWDYVLTPASPPWKDHAAAGPSAVIVDGKRKSTRQVSTVLPPAPATPVTKSAPADEVMSSGKKISPPWKSFSAAGPTSVIEDGKRKSTRARVPLEEEVNGVPGKDRLKGSRVNGYGKKVKDRRGFKKPDATEFKMPQKRIAAGGQDGYAKKRQYATGRGHKRQTSQLSQDKTPRRVNRTTQPNDPDSTSPYTRIKLRFRAPITKVPTMNPLHYPKPRTFASFAEWSEKHEPFLAEDRNDVWTEQTITREVQSRLRVMKAMGPGGALSVERCSQRDLGQWREPRPKFGHTAFMTAHAIHFRKLLRQERDKHAKHAKLLATACQAAIQTMEKWAFLRQSKTATELWEEQLGYQIKRYKQLVRDLENRWLFAKAEVRQLRLKTWEAEQEIAGKQALDEMLSKSQAVLRHNPFDHPNTHSDAESSIAGSSDVETGTHGSRTDADASEEESGSGEDSENMSESSESEGEEQDVVGDEDEHLSPEALRLKYAEALEQDRSDAEEEEDANGTAEEDGEADSDEDEDNRSEEGSARGNSERTPARVDSLTKDDDSVALSDEISSERHRDDVNHDEVETADSLLTEGVDGPDAAVAEDYNPPALDEVDDMLLESDEDHSTDMESDMGSDEGSWASESEDDVGNSMMGFFNSTQLLKMKAQQEAEPADPKSDSADRDEEPTAPSKQDGDADIDMDESDGETASLSVAKVHGMQSTESQSSPRSTPGTPGSLSLPNTPTFRPKTEIPSQLLRGTLREYQHDGLDWLAKLYAGGRNGILADEMGLGKTVQTIALLAHLAVHYEVWGPHLVVVPTSVMLNWEMEFKKFCPGFKILTYYGTQEERRQKRKGWLDDDKWNVCITSYQLILQDAAAFKKRSWHYLVLDEAHNIKNFQTQRWQTLLTFKTHSRLLLTGTPLQNNLQELWSLLYFLMPAGTDGAGGFADLEKFLNSLKKPADQILDQGRQKLDAEAQARVSKLHEVLRPYLLRRLKADVEKQMPGKYEHVIYCRLSKRQRQLYDEFMGRADTKRTLSSGNYMSIINCLMSLRKVCNHPDLFETRQIVTSFAMPRSAVANYEITELLVRRRLLTREKLDLEFCGLLPASFESTNRELARRTQKLSPIRQLEAMLKEQSKLLESLETDNPEESGAMTLANLMSLGRKRAQQEIVDELQRTMTQVRRTSRQQPMYGPGWIQRLTLESQWTPKRPTTAQLRRAQYSWGEWALTQNYNLHSLMPTLPDIAERSEVLVQKFSCVTPAIVAEDTNRLVLTQRGQQLVQEAKALESSDPYHEARIRSSIQFPDKRLLQYDCGKLQALDKLLRDLQVGGHRCLIFTQMTKVLDILEQFLNIHGHRYLRLDGATKIEQRQILTDRFNSDTRILAFILSSRSGGLGINLTGADTVIFYDLDWNPAMDAQCQDRCHRIGQTRDVHIYRFVSEYTIEANILRKSNQKRLLDDVIIQKGEFNTNVFNRVTYRDAFATDDEVAGDNEAGQAMDRILGDAAGLGQAFELAEDKEDTVAAKVAQKEMVQVDDADFNEQQTAETAAPAPVDGGKDTITLIDAVVDEVQANKENLLDEDELPHVDDYMVRFLMEELKNVPVVPPGVAAAAKKARKKAPDWRRR